MTAAHYGWKIGHLEILQDPSVGAILHACRDDPRPFVAFHPETRDFEVILPRQARSLAERLGLGPDDDARKQGFLDTLRQDQSTFPEDKPATEVFDAMQKSGAVAGILLDPDDRPVRLVVPSMLHARLPHVSVLQGFPEIREFVTRSLSRSDLAGGIRAIERSGIVFHSELINEANPIFLECDGGGGHIVARCPCHVREHRGANCAPQTVR